MYKKKFSVSNVELEFQEEVKSQVSIIVFDRIFWQQVKVTVTGKSFN